MANTTNLNLVKPAGTDHALISDINGNMDIIDAAIGELPSGSNLQGEIDSLNSKLTANNLGSISSASALQTALDSVIQNIGQYEIQVVSFYAGASFAGFVSGSRYQGIVHVISKSSSATYYSVMFESSKDDAPVLGNNANGTWVWATITLGVKSGSVSFASSDFSTVSLGTFTHRAAKSPISGVTKILSASAVAPGSSWVLLPQISSGENGIVLLANSAGAVKVNYLYV